MHCIRQHSFTFQATHVRNIGPQQKGGERMWPPAIAGRGVRGGRGGARQLKAKGEEALGGPHAEARVFIYIYIYVHT